ncbi:glycosyltransferase family 4 protein [Chamaesiphon sp. GL140_3_metabinner_50]|uniref:glycosyltransferase family 4 protein n=1 Tax=Chamaesiphon sp. GL140_3_metabinner_50 TaxID=2970812 RepID=UPI0025EB0066|nr:glycosyltransferase family 4 protein [Chamaesiphon sp. GL140_3_metabinner_50]
MKILFLDQSGKPGGAELCLLDIAKTYRGCLVCLFADGFFRTMLEEEQIPVKVLATAIDVQKDSSTLQGVYSIGRLLPLAISVARLSRKYDLIYANTQKALVVGALASVLSRRSLVFHLHDILSLEHFSKTNQRIAVTLANRFASLVIANSQASQSAFIAAGGQAKLTQVVYNGFNLAAYRDIASQRQPTRQALGFTDRDFVVGHFSRLAPWKGQHLLIEALTHCPESVSAMFVGDALFGERDYVTQLQQQVKDLHLEHRVRFVGFRSDVAELMAACDLVAHTSTAPEPFGRVIVEAMLCGTPVVAAAAGGAMELVADGVTGWLVAPGDPVKLAAVIVQCYDRPSIAQEIAATAQIQASQRFDLTAIARQIDRILVRVVG